MPSPVGSYYASVPLGYFWTRRIHQNGEPRAERRAASVRSTKLDYSAEKFGCLSAPFRPGPLSIERATVVAYESCATSRVFIRCNPRIPRRVTGGLIRPLGECTRLDRRGQRARPLRIQGSFTSVAIGTARLDADPPANKAGCAVLKSNRFGHVGIGRHGWRLSPIADQSRMSA